MTCLLDTPADVAHTFKRFRFTGPAHLALHSMTITYGNPPIFNELNDWTSLSPFEPHLAKITIYLTKKGPRGPFSLLFNHDQF